MIMAVQDTFGVFNHANDWLVQMSGIQRTYLRGSETIHALDGLDLNLARGSFTLLVGPSGGGKSTLLHVLGGIDRPTAGHVQVNGWALENASESQLTRFRRENVGFIFQFYNLLPFISALENVALPLLALGRSRPAALREAEAWLERVGLDGRKLHKPAELSGGEQQRVAIARAVAAGPCLLLADEPTGDLDGASAALVMALLRDLNRQLGTTCLVATHNLQLIQPADRLLRLSHGRLEEVA
jgi:ABC-type lipoprotein export system ATPase subunit